MMGTLNVIAEPGKHDLVLTREFDAPRALVFRAMTAPELVARWWGHEPFATTVEALDARPGGSWRFTMTGEGTEPMSHYGYFHVVDAPAQVVYTYEFSGMPGHIGLVTATLEERDGKTFLTE